MTSKKIITKRITSKGQALLGKELEKLMELDQ